MISSSLKFAAVAVLIVAVAGALLTRKTFHVEQVIAAPLEDIWSVLMDTAAYPDWNPVFVEVTGEYVEGAKILNKVRDQKGNILEMTAKVTTVREARELRQTGGIPGVITFDHQWLLEPVEGGTKVTQHEVDRGLYLWLWDSSWIEPAYAETLRALRDHVQNDT